MPTVLPHRMLILADFAKPNDNFFLMSLSCIVLTKVTGQNYSIPCIKKWGLSFKLCTAVMQYSLHCFLGFQSTIFDYFASIVTNTGFISYLECIF